MTTTTGNYWLDRVSREQEAQPRREFEWFHAGLIGVWLAAIVVLIVLPVMSNGPIAFIPQLLVFLLYTGCCVAAWVNDRRY
jgi:hypothetical protein